MNPYAAYKDRAPGWTRIDLLLSMYDGAIERLEKAVEALKRNDAAAANPLLRRTELIVGELAAGVDKNYGELPNTILRLYEFILHNLGMGGVEQVEAALKVLRTLRDGFQGIREEAVSLERSGQIPPADSMRTLQVDA